MAIASVDNEFIQNVVEQYSDMLMRIAYQNLKNQSDSEDVVQEAFIKLMKQPVFEDENIMKAWLIRVTINLCKDFKRNFWFRKVEPLTEVWAPFTDDENGIIDELFKLSKDYRNVIYLYYFEEYKINEIAIILNKNENTISSQLTRARKKLKGILLEEDYNNEK